MDSSLTGRLWYHHNTHLYDMHRLLLILALLLVAGPANAQWVNISEAGRTYTDFAVKGSVIVATNDGGANSEAIFTSSDLGQSWVANGPNGARSARNVLATPNGFVVQVSGNHDFLSNDTGTAWTGVDGVGGNTTSYFFDDTNGRLYATTQSANLRVSSDNGLTWSSTAVSSRDSELTWVHARGDVIFTAYNQFGGDTFLSTDGGATFVDTDLGATSAGFIAEDGTLYVVTAPFSAGNVPAVLKRSDDGGATWIDVNTPPGLGGIFGQQSTPLRQKSLLFVAGQSIMYGPNDRVYVSHDGGASFADMSDGLVAAGARKSTIRTMQIVGSDMYVLVVDSNDEAPTNAGYGIYRRPLSELGFDPTTVATERMELPTLSAALWPNPSSGHGSIRIDAPAPGPVTFTLHDMLGREVFSQELGVASTGTQTFQWSADLPGGVYAARIQAAGRSQTRVVTFVR